MNMSKRTQKFTKEELALVKHEAEKIARIYGLDPAKVFKAMLPSIESVGIVGKEVWIKCYSDKVNFREVLEYLSPDQTIKLFEKQDINYFGKLLDFAKWLADDYNYFYNLSDLQTGLSQLVKYFSQNENSLVETGYSEKEFEVSPWLGWMIGLTYPVKLRLPEESGHRWRKHTGQGMRDFGDPCDYVDADHFLINDAIDWQKLDKSELRTKVLEFKKCVLSKLSDAIQSCGPDGIGEDAAIDVVKTCFQSGAGILDPDEIDFLCLVDQPENNLGLPINPYAAIARPIRFGGLADVISVFGHVALEIALRPYSDGRIRLNPYELEKPRIGIKFNLNDFFIDYSAKSAGWFEEVFQKHLNSKLCTNEFWDKFHSKKDEWIKNIRNNPIASSLTFNRSIEKHKLIEAEKNEYQFVSRGDYCEIVFRGKRNSFRSLIGMDLISLLLEHPGRDIHVIALSELADKHDFSAIKDSIFSLTKEELADIGLRESALDDPFELVDRKTIREVTKQYSEIQERLAVNSYEQPQLLIEDRKKLAFLDKYLKGVKDFQGESRKFANPVDKARQRVKKALARALDKISRQDIEVYKHLFTAIKTGTFCSYQPIDPIHWEIKFTTEK